MITDQSTEVFLDNVRHERFRQDEKWGEQHHDDGTGSPHFRYMADHYKDQNDRDANQDEISWAGIMLEELYEALAEEDQANLRAELVQVAAVAGAWVKDIDSRRVR